MVSTPGGVMYHSRMALSVVAQTIEADVNGTVVTEIVLDTPSGTYVREFRFYGPGDTEGETGPLLLTVRAKSSDKAALQYTTKGLTL
jgi:hypothetical protein